MNPLNHIDLRVSDMESALPFYRKLMPALGFTRNVPVNEANGIAWQVFLLEERFMPPVVFGITEEPSHQPNRNCIAFGVASWEEVERIAEIVREAGGRNIESPCVCPEYAPDYYALFFEDPSGNRLEVCARSSKPSI